MTVQIFPTTVAVATMPTTYARQLWKCDATAGAFAMGLPDATLCQGNEITIAKVDAGANAVTINRAGSQTIVGTGGVAQTSLSLATVGKSFTLISDGANWVITCVV